jgi:glycosyltransferase involved in cell wall biosynthesis
MKLSIITPTHDITFLKELEASILVQTYQDWEWVILLNHGAKYSAIDPRIKIEVSPFESDSVGLLKRLACMQTTGEAILEVDHDDLITPDCLDKIAKAFRDPEIGFVYSTNAKLSKDFRPYGDEYGWSYGTYKWEGRHLYAMNNQPIYPGRFGYIWFAPDHIRAWRKSVYEDIGGHNDSLSICDDIDLMHRLYLKTKFLEIPEVLYIYRITKNNTFLKKGDLIQEESSRLYDENILALASRFADLNDLKKLDLSGNGEKPAGFISIGSEETDIIADMEIGIPLPDNSVGVIRADNALPFIKNKLLLMSEIHRVLAPGGMLLSQTPSTDGPGAFTDPRYVSYWNEQSFWYWTKEKYAKQIKNRNLFRVSKLKTVHPDEHYDGSQSASVIAHLEKLEPFKN